MERQRNPNCGTCNLHKRHGQSFSGFQSLLFNLKITNFLNLLSSVEQDPMSLDLIRNCF